MANELEKKAREILREQVERERPRYHLNAWREMEEMNVVPEDAAILAVETALQQSQQPAGDIVVTRNDRGLIVAVTRQDAEGRILSVVATNPQYVIEPPPLPEGVSEEDVRGLIERLRAAIVNTDHHHFYASEVHKATAYLARLAAKGGV